MELVEAGKAASTTSKVAFEMFSEDIMAWAPAIIEAELSMPWIEPPVRTLARLRVKTPSR